jgi:hypothetical protein
MYGQRLLAGFGQPEEAQPTDGLVEGERILREYLDPSG